jgi:hypothetical protein
VLLSFNYMVLYGFQTTIILMNTLHAPTVLVCAVCVLIEWAAEWIYNVAQTEAALSSFNKFGSASEFSERWNSMNRWMDCCYGRMQSETGKVYD